LPLSVFVSDTLQHDGEVVGIELGELACRFRREHRACGLEIKGGADEKPARRPFAFQAAGASSPSTSTAFLRADGGFTGTGWSGSIHPQWAQK
jgi:hypothetical protein